jgi:hypothetical protein
MLSYSVVDARGPKAIPTWVFIYNMINNIKKERWRSKNATTGAAP